MPGIHADMSRRSFIKTGAVVSGAAVAAGSAVALAEEGGVDGAAQGAEGMLMPNPGQLQFHPPVQGEVAYVADPIADSEIVQTVECDVVICGAGLSGLSCAVSASENGLATVVLEKGSVFAARGTEIGAIGDSVHVAAGVELDPTQYLNDAMNTAHFRCDRNVWMRWIERSGEALDWGMEKTLDNCGSFYCLGGNSVYEGVTTWGTGVRMENGFYSFVEGLEAVATASGAQILYETPAVQLVQEEGKIVGVIAKAAEGYVKYLASLGVVLATGGYEHNWDMIAQRCRPRDMAVYAWNNPTVTDTGDGILMGLAVGAAEDDYPHVLMNDPAGALTGNRANGIMPAFLRVNLNGERFVNESLSFEYMTNAIMYQTGACDYVLMSGDLAAAIDAAKGGAPWSTEDMIASIEPVMVQADTLEGLAEACGINYENLAKTIERYNELCALGEDLDFGKSASALLPLEEGPYYAVQESGTCLVTVNGLRTDADSHVLDIVDQPIAGLYALGNTSGSMFFGTYPHHMSAISHGRCLTFGYLLGRRLAGLE